MDYLIIIAIVAIALLLTGLTNLDALRRPFRSKAGRPVQASDSLPESRSADRPAQADKPHAD